MSFLDGPLSCNEWAGQLLDKKARASSRPGWSSRKNNLERVTIEPLSSIAVDALCCATDVPPVQILALRLQFVLAQED